MQEYIMVDPLISVIVPVYNIENYIIDSVDSILNQSYKNLEVLLVDDGSTDKTGTICDDYGANDCRVKVFHVKHGGVSYARNIALDNMHGEYVVFVDGDDYLNKLYIEVLYGDLVRMKADISTCCFTEIPLDGMGICRTITPCDMLSKKDGLKELLYKNKINSYVLTKMFRSSLFSDIRFPDGNLYGDTAVLYKLFEKAHRVSNNTYSGYYYFIRKSSTSFLKFSPKKLDLIHNAENMKNYLGNRFPELENPIAFSVVCDNLLAYLQIPQRWKYRKYRKLAKNNIRKLRFRVINDYDANPYLRLALGISYFSFPLLYFLNKLKLKR